MALRAWRSMPQRDAPSACPDVPRGRLRSVPHPDDLGDRSINPPPEG
ncbi:MAG: hypothetical protein RQ885_01615 [Desulfurococcales archaeon]|nr:hypothetical protein [Desulfurococcales archaeon]